MAGQVSPGIVLRERDLTNSVAVATQANTAALVGVFEKGPVGVITTISSEQELVSTFGKPNTNNYEDWFVASTFLGYGGQLQVIRVADSALKNAASEVTSVSSDDTKLFIQNTTGFSNGDVVKVDSEYFAVTAVDSSAETLTVTRAQYGSSSANHSILSTVTKWSLAQDGGLAATTTAEDLDASEKIITLSQTNGISAGDYLKIGSEFILVESVEDTNIVGTRGALASTAATSTTGATVERWTFTATATSTELTAGYPVVSGSTAPQINSFNEFEANQSSYTFKFAARTSGAWGNSLKVAVVDGSISALAYTNATYHGTSKWSTLGIRPTSADECHVAIIDEDGAVSGTAGTLLESFLFVSRNTAAVGTEGESNYYPNVINRRSRYVYAAALAAAGLQSYSLSGGVDNYEVSSSSIDTALSSFNDVENVEVDFILAGGSITYGGTPRDATKTKALKAIEIAANRKDCIAFVSPYRSFVSLSDTAAQKDAILEYFSLLTSSSYAVFDSGYKYIYDRYNDVYRYIPCCGDVAGLCVQTSITLEDWFSPAGLQRGNLRNAIKLAYTPSKTDRDELYQNRINPITSFPGQGVVLFGDKTALATPSAFDRINVRRLFLTIQKRVRSVARSVLFELNDTTTRNSFFTTVNAFMGEVQAKRGVTDYLVVCDETNNTPEVIDRNEFVAEIYVKPTRSINYITITFVATKTGVSFAEVTGQV
jgi:hypothetical protein